MEVRALRDLSMEAQDAVARFVDAQTDLALPYHMPAFARVVDAVFGYENLSLVAMDHRKAVVGYLPQWRHGKIIESVPWRDKGGPLAICRDAREALTDRTIELVESRGLKGAVWKDYRDDALSSRGYLINVDIDLSSLTREQYWRALSNKVRGKVRRARKNGLRVRSPQGDWHATLREFYDLFALNRKRLGVPVYPFRLFAEYARQLGPQGMRMFTVTHQGAVVAALILFYNTHVAIDAYSASNHLGMQLKANDLLLFEVIADCIDRGIGRFDFGADSPLQQSLIDYKCKWLGKKRLVPNTVFGQVTDSDHNRPEYAPLKWMIRRLPAPLYAILSRLVVR